MTIVRGADNPDAIEFYLYAVPKDKSSEKADGTVKIRCLEEVAKGDPTCDHMGSNFQQASRKFRLVLPSLGICIRSAVYISIREDRSSAFDWGKLSQRCLYVESLNRFSLAVHIYCHDRLSVGAPRIRPWFRQGPDWKRRKWGPYVEPLEPCASASLRAGCARHHQPSHESDIVIRPFYISYPAHETYLREMRECRMGLVPTQHRHQIAVHHQRAGLEGVVGLDDGGHILQLARQRQQLELRVQQLPDQEDGEQDDAEEDEEGAW